MSTSYTENPDASKFKPEEYKWTSYDGISRNYVQILEHLKNITIKVVNIEELNDKVSEEIIKAIAEHFDNYVDRCENGYNGIIKIIKLAADSCISNENVDDEMQLLN